MNWNVFVKHIKLIIMIEIMPSDVRKVFEHLNKQVECSDDGMDHNDLVVQTTLTLSDPSARALVSVFVPVLHLVKSKN